MSAVLDTTWPAGRGTEGTCCGGVVENFGTNSFAFGLKTNGAAFGFNVEG